MLAAGTVTLAGTLAAWLLVRRMTCAPPAGAGPLSITVAVDCEPPMALVGFNGSEHILGGTGVAVSEADALVPPEEAEIVTGVDVATALVLIVKVAVVLPAG